MKVGQAEITNDDLEKQLEKVKQITRELEKAEAELKRLRSEVDPTEHNCVACRHVNINKYHYPCYGCIEGAGEYDRWEPKE